MDLKIKFNIFFITFFSIFIICLFASTIYAEDISDTIHLNIQVTDSANNDNPLPGTYNFVFNITLNYTCNSSVLYANSATLVTDGQGRVSYYLNNINLPYDQQYFMCYYRDNTFQGVFNISRVPYAFTAKNVTWAGIINKPEILNSTELNNTYVSYNNATSNLNLNNKNITTTGWIVGLYNWIIGINPSQRYLSFNGTTLEFNENNLNETIDNRITISGAANGTYNATYELWSYNQTTPAINYVNSQGYLTSTIGNATYLLLTDQRYNETNLINSVNTTINIQQLLNSTNIYSTFNSSYALYSYNQTYGGSTYNATYELWSYNQTTGAINYINGQGFLTSLIGNNTYLKLDDQRYNNTLLIESVNSTSNIQILLNSTGIYSTYNVTYDLWSYNQTAAANVYTDNVNVTNYNWVTSTFLSISNALTQYFNKTDIQIQYYNKTDIDLKRYINDTNIAYTNRSNTFLEQQNFTNGIASEGNLEIWFD